MARICVELGDDDAAAEYEDASRLIADAYHRRYFNEARGDYGMSELGYRQTMNILPLAFGAVPDKHVDSVASSLIADIENRTAGHLDCGAVGVKYLLPVLTDHGRPDLAVTVATQQTRPGWGVWKGTGAQTLFENWDEDPRSHDHYFLGSVAGWIQASIGGLRPTAPGWAAFEVAPIIDDRISTVRISHRTVRGGVSLQWRQEGRRFAVELSVPTGARARIVLPGAPERLYESGEHRLAFDLAELDNPG